MRCFRGIDTLTALALHLELGGDWQRFRSPRPLFAWLGLTPSLDQSGQSAARARSPRPARSTPAGCWSSRPGTTPASPAIGVTLKARQQDAPDHVLQIAWRAQHRLHRLHHRLRERGKPHNVATIAVARELSGFLWAAATAP